MWLGMPRKVKTKTGAGTSADGLRQDKARSRRVILEFVFNGSTPIVRKAALMNRFRQAITYWGVGVLLGATPLTSAFGQARPIEVPELNTQFTSSGVANLRVGSVSEDGTEALLVMEYTYNGNAGPTALIVPVIESRRERGVARWFGSDRVIVPRGKGPISFKVRFFNDEPGAPATITTDSIRMLFLNSTGTAIIGGSTELKTINWGKAGVQPAQPTSAVEPAAERRLAQLAGEAEERAREKARRAAEAQERAQRETAEREAARAKAAAEARAAEDAKAKADAEAKVRAEEKRKAEEKAATEARAREEASRKAEAEARRLGEERKAAEARARAQAEAQEKARLEAEARKREQEQKQAEAEAARLQEERRKAEAQAAAEAKAREEAEAKAQLEARRLDEERQAAEARVRAEEEAKRISAERAAAEARAREQAEAQAAEAARIKAEQEAAEAARLKAELAAQAVAEQASAVAGKSRTKITNVDVVNRSLDRSQMTIGIEFDRKDKFDYMGVSVEHSANPSVKNYFTCEPKEVGRQKYALVQVAYAKPSASASTVVTDRLQIYGTESPGAVEPIPLHTATMLLVWRAPGSTTGAAEATPAPAQMSSVEITDFRQRTPTSGYASVTYRLLENSGQLRVRLKNSAQPGSNGWFLTEPVAVKAGQGLELIPVTVSAENAPGGALNVDTIEVELLDAAGKVISQTVKTTSITWSREQ